MAARVTGDTSDDTHLADDSKRRENAAGSYGYAPPVQEGGRMTGDTSVDAHHAGHAFTDTSLALMSYPAPAITAAAKAPAATAPAASTVPPCAAKYRDDHTLYVYDRTTFTNRYIPDDIDKGEAIVLTPDCDPWEALLPFVQRQATNS